MTSLDRRLPPGFLEEALRADARTGLTAVPKSLPPKWFYDAQGSALFDKITELPEYYPTRAEREILRASAAGIAAQTGARTLIELGSGSSDKTRLLLDALRDAGTLRCYVPVDVSEPALAAAGKALSSEYPGLDVRAVVSDFEERLGFPADGEAPAPRLVAFLGSTIGNLEPRQRAHGRVRRGRGDAHRDLGQVPPRGSGGRTGRRRVRDAVVVDGFGGSVRAVAVGASNPGASAGAVAGLSQGGVDEGGRGAG